ncbi:Glycosyl hydrolases family 16 [Rhodococcus rhodochrous J3]|uniref:Glycoside hydrolase family 16 protein n=2 Tax=Rhodococcus rhodochrous TaxID=1829 RepID=A0AA46WYH1_RHORH|nr:glycoside hydrolase family 16 protein [Rhodococcus rhodochrous]MBF4481474.1 glycoside hydrolase family 16 protein [Rhodococcus rhodochrous]MCB8912795.1 glycoside hydrolase family 16 protein [Rhodococcus rhodochrous]TWH52951.1 Beta-glucanase/Beta-glucan synthetase [Rhodococcus rhodochrous J38]UZF46300.1 glycoside hydrolase family 16 protein [Rhodococcus rhodochrous]SMG31975.1 Glycosyl hydrolases family 16 [Rhodococcus rhodochrous J3]
MTGRRTVSVLAAALTLSATAATTACSVLPTASPSPACTVATEPAGGVPMPSGNLPGWTQIFTDDFDRCELGDSWGTYSGQPGGNPLGEWNHSMVSVDGDVLELRSERTDSGWVSGGVSNFPVAQTYGRWEIRMRADVSDDISYHMLLWPQDEQWPPEIDFAESVDGHREEMSAFLHWKKPNGERDKHGVSIAGDFSDWHTVGVEWGPGIVRYLLDGKVWAEAHSDEMVPDVPMWLGMQAEGGSCERRVDWGLEPCSEDSDLRADEVSVEIDWVTVYEPDFAVLEQMYRDGQFAPTDSAIQFTDR